MTQESQNGKSQGSNSAVESGVHFTEADFRAIAKELRTECTLGLKNQLISAAANYLSLKDYWANRESTAELRTHLTAIGKQAKKLRQSLHKLTPLGHVVFERKIPDLERVIGDIRCVEETAENEVQYLKFDKGGAPTNAPLIMHIMMLAKIYHDHTGKTPGYTTHPIKELRGGPFLRFVMANLRAVEPDVAGSENEEQKIAEVIKYNLKLIRKVLPK